MKRLLTIDEEIFLNQFSQNMHSLDEMNCWFETYDLLNKRDSVKEMSRAGPKKGAQNQPCQPRSFQGMSEKEEKFKQNQVQ